jgi:hypothetical protein
MGQLAWQEEVRISGEQHIRVAAGHLSPGIYVLSIRGERSEKTLKMVID